MAEVQTSPLPGFASALTSALPAIPPKPLSTQLAEATHLYSRKHDSNVVTFKPTDNELGRIAESEAGLQMMLNVIVGGKDWREIMQQAGDEYAVMIKRKALGPVTDLMRAHSIQFKITERRKLQTPFIKHHCHLHEINWDSVIPQPVKLTVASIPEETNEASKENIGVVVVENHFEVKEQDAAEKESKEAKNVEAGTMDAKANPLTSVVVIGYHASADIKLEPTDALSTDQPLLAICIVPSIRQVLVYSLNISVKMTPEGRKTRNSPLAPKALLKIPFKTLIDPHGASEGLLQVDIGLPGGKSLPLVVAGCKICIICVDKPRAQLFRKCRHYVTCRDCATQMPKCPIRNGNIHPMDKKFPVLITGGDQASHRRY